MERFCVKCGKKFEAAGREVICPECKTHAAEDAKRAAVLKAKQASWTGESVPVRISGRASTVIRAYGAAHNLSFASALNDLLKSTDYFKSTGKAWADITPYKSHRRDKHATEDVKQAAKSSSKTTSKTSKAAKKVAKTSKAAK